MSHLRLLFEVKLLLILLLVLQSMLVPRPGSLPL